MYRGEITPVILYFRSFLGIMTLKHTQNETETHLNKVIQCSDRCIPSLEVTLGSRFHDPKKDHREIAGAKFNWEGSVESFGEWFWERLNFLFF